MALTGALVKTADSGIEAQRSGDDGEHRLIGEAVRAAQLNRCRVEPHRAVSFGTQGSRTDENHIAQSSQEVENPLVRLPGKTAREAVIGGSRRRCSKRS